MAFLPEHETEVTFPGGYVSVHCWFEHEAVCSLEDIAGSIGRRFECETIASFEAIAGAIDRCCECETLISFKMAAGWDSYRPWCDTKLSLRSRTRQAPNLELLDSALSSTYATLRRCQLDRCDGFNSPWRFYIEGKSSDSGLLDIGILDFSFSLTYSVTCFFRLHRVFSIPLPC